MLYEIKREETVIQANNVGKFYSFVNGKMTCHSGVGALKTSDGCIVLSDSAKAELLNILCQLVFSIMVSCHLLNP